MLVEGDPCERFLKEIRDEFPRFRLIHKDRCATQRLIHYALLGLTLGGMRSYMTAYQTTIGQTIYVAAGWDELLPVDRYIKLRHERVHLRQFRRYTLVGMAIVYLLLPLPMGLAYCRARFEQAGYAETIRASAEVYGLAHVRDDAFRDDILDNFTGPAYGWMWPFRRHLASWYARVLCELETQGMERDVE